MVARIGDSLGSAFDAVDGEAVQTRGDSKRRPRDFSKYLLSKRLEKLRNLLSS